MFGGLPVPKMKFSWVSAAILLMASFYLYYGLFYRDFVQAYSEKIYQSRVFTTEDNNFSGYVTVPNFISSYAARPIRILIINELEGTEPHPLENITVTVYLEPEEGQDRESALILDPKKDEMKNSYFIEQFHAHETIEFEIPVQATANQYASFFVTYPAKDKNGNFQYQGDNLLYETEEINVSRPKLIYDPVKTYVQVAIEYLLMPPISNGLVPILVAFAVFSMEFEREFDEKKNKLKSIEKFYVRDMNQGIATFIFSGVLLGMIFYLLYTAFIVFGEVSEILEKNKIDYSDWPGRWGWTIFCAMLIFYFVYWLYDARIKVGNWIEAGWSIESWSRRIARFCELSLSFLILSLIYSIFQVALEKAEDLLSMGMWGWWQFSGLVIFMVFVYKPFQSQILNWFESRGNIFSGIIHTLVAVFSFSFFWVLLNSATNDSSWLGMMLRVAVIVLPKSFLLLIDASTESQLAAENPNANDNRFDVVEIRFEGSVNDVAVLKKKENNLGNDDEKPEDSNGAKTKPVSASRLNIYVNETKRRIGNTIRNAIISKLKVNEVEKASINAPADEMPSASGNDEDEGKGDEDDVADNNNDEVKSTKENEAEPASAGDSGNDEDEGKGDEDADDDDKTKREWDAHEDEE